MSPEQEPYDWVDQMWRERPDDMRRAAIRYQEAVQAGGGEQIRRAIAGLITTATVCGAVTWAGWVIPAVCRWWSA